MTYIQHVQSAINVLKSGGLPRKVTALYSLIVTVTNVLKLSWKSWNQLTRGPRTLALCLTPAVSMTNGNFLQTYTKKLMRYRPSKCEWPWHWSFKVTKVKCKHTLRLRLYALLLMFNSNIWPTLLLYDIHVYKASKCEWPCIWPLKVTQGQMWRCHWTLPIWFPIND